MNIKRIAGLLSGVIFLGTMTGGVAIAQENGPGYGMMRGHESAERGPWMMGGCSSDYGSRSWMVGRDGYGMGPWMMGGYGPLAALDLSNAQRDRIFKILESDRRQRWAVMGKMMDDEYKLRELLAQDQPDPKKVGAIYGQISALRQKMVVAHVQASNEIHNVLTAKQRDHLQQWRRGAWGPQPGWGFHPNSPYGGSGGSRP